MINSRKIQVLGATALAAALLFSFSTAAIAVGKPGTVGNPSSASAKERASQNKIKACQAKENGIKSRSTHLSDLVKNMEDKFDAIAQRVKDYYTSTVVPSGKTVANYDALLADIQTKKTAVQTALTTAQNDFTGFSCTSGNPKKTLISFRYDMQKVKEALKSYRTSIKNLIVAVHGVAGDENKNSGQENEKNLSDCRAACGRSCGANASCLEECYANCRSNNSNK